MTRIPDLEKEEMTPRQLEVYNDIVQNRPSLSGPFSVWLHSPEFCDRAQRVGEFVRLKCSVPPRLRELAILIVASSMDCQSEWAIHVPFARKAGIKDEVIKALSAKAEVPFERQDERDVYTFTKDIMDKHFVTDDVFQNLVKHLGETGTIEMTGLVGYYTLVAMTLNVFEVPVPEIVDPTLENGPLYTGERSE